MTKTEKITEANGRIAELTAKLERQEKLIALATEGMKPKAIEDDVVVQRLLKSKDSFATALDKTRGKIARLEATGSTVDVGAWVDQLDHALREARVKDWVVTPDEKGGKGRAHVHGDESGRFKVVAKPRGRHCNIMIPNDPGTIATVLAAINGIAKVGTASKPAPSKGKGKSAAKTGRK